MLSRQSENVSPPTIQEALFYLDQVKRTFFYQPQVYRDFIDILMNFRAGRIGVLGVIRHLARMFRGHPGLIVRFNRFLPPGFLIVVEPDEQVKVILDVEGYIQPSTIIISPGRPPGTSPQFADSQSNRARQTAPPNSFR